MNLALIGLGAWGKNILRTLVARHDCSVTIICDPNKPSDDVKKIFAGKDMPEYVSDPKELHNRPNLDAILIATPGTTHADIALPFIKKGLPVFIEKPFTTSLADAKKLAKTAKTSGSLVFVGHIHMYNPAYQKVKELLPSLGELRYLSFEGMNNGPFRSDMSALWDWAPHDVVMALDLLQSEPKKIKSWGFNLLGTNQTDMTFANLTFPKNISVTLQVSWLAPEKRKKLTIVGSISSLVFDDTAVKKITLYENMGPVVSNGQVLRQQPIISYPEYAQDLPLEKEMTAFLAMIKTKTKPLTSLEQGVKVVKIIETIQKASTKNH